MMVIWQMLSELGNVILCKNLEAWSKTFMPCLIRKDFVVEKKTAGTC